VLIVFHDNTLKVGVPYRYRVRVVFANPLQTQDAVQNRALDSFPKEIVSGWSEWSDPVVVQNPTQFFLTPRKALEGGRPQVTVFTQKMGQVVYKAFDVEPGGPIGGVEKVLVAMAGNTPVAVDFSTGCVVVIFEDRKIPGRGLGGGPAPETTTPAMLYLDAKGRLRWRTLAEDQNSAEYKKLRAEAGGGP
jgi:hypothetical protein